MTEENYDPYAGFYRVATAAEKLSMEVVEVITFHLVLEREIELFLSKTLARVDKLGGLGFTAKAAILHSTWQDTTEKADKLYFVLRSFNDLRNAVAHGNPIAKVRLNLFEAYRSIDPHVKEPLSYGAIAQGVCAYMGGGMMPDEFVEFAATFHRIVHEILPAAMKPR